MKKKRKKKSKYIRNFVPSIEINKNYTHTHTHTHTHRNSGYLKKMLTYI